MSSLVSRGAGEPDSTPDSHSPVVYLLPVTDAQGVRRTLILDEKGLAEYRRTHLPRPLEEMIGAWGSSDDEWEEYLRWEDGRKRESPPTPSLDEEFPELFDDR